MQRKGGEDRKREGIMGEADHGRHIWNVAVGTLAHSHTGKNNGNFSSLGFPQREKMTAQCLGGREGERELYVESKAKSET